MTCKLLDRGERSQDRRPDRNQLIPVTRHFPARGLVTMAYNAGSASHALHPGDRR